MPPEHAALPLPALLQRLERARPTPNRDARDFSLQAWIAEHGLDRLRR